MKSMKAACVLLLCSILFYSSLTTGYAASIKSYNLYDESGRLINTKLSNGEVLEYQYDLNGNVIRKANHNKFINADFEVYKGTNGIADGWGNWHSAAVTTQYQVVPRTESKKAQQFASSNLPKDGTSNIYQDIVVTGETPYTVSGQLAIADLRNAKVQVVIHYFDAKDNIIGSETPFEYGGNTDWLSINGQATTPAGAVWARVHFNVLATEAGAHATITVDSVVFQKGVHTNLLTNADFETDSQTNGVAEGWRNWHSGDVKGLYQVVARTESKKAQQLAASNMPKDGTNNVYQDVAVKGEAPYTVSGQLAIADLKNAKIQVAVHYFDINNQFIGNEIPFEFGGNTDWLSINGQIKTPVGAVRARIHFNTFATENGGHVTVTLDSVALKKGARPNLLINADFEKGARSDGVAESWANWHSADVVGKYQLVSRTESKKAQQLAASNMPKNGSNNVFQDVSVIGGTTYTVSGQIAIANLQKAKMQITIHYFDINNRYLGYEIPFEYGENTNWRNINGQVKTPSDAVRARIHFNTYATEAGGHVTLTVDSAIFQRAAVK
ncbi:RHS repeat domain-containing protein [Paenibacillus assamensis]|uniref:RHS repeat domain-containing protein n=1 Tax=Paenibacillus assamensis TaxID=311244 RepID=UPI00146F8644|nr:RHS repeat domain-containing protein [Paenibacillus assamensis]